MPCCWLVSWPQKTSQIVQNPDSVEDIEKIEASCIQHQAKTCWRSLPGRDLAAVIKSAASAASRNPRGAQPPAVVRLPGRRPWAPLGFLEAALAADLITASKSFRGGCASSRLDHGCPKMAKNLARDSQRLLLSGTSGTLPILEMHVPGLQGLQAKPQLGVWSSGARMATTGIPI